jgi:beta-1,4-N-acetylglucosaminyltransferase
MSKHQEVLYPRVLITVGTTEFDDLIKEIDNNFHVLEYLKLLGCQQLSLQFGRGAYEPSNIIAQCKSLDIALNMFRFHPTLSDEMSGADLIISHCGAGSILEAVSLHKMLIVVVNPTLQGNHQEELSHAMSSKDYCISTIPKELSKLLYDFVNNKTWNRISFPEPDYDIFPRLIDEVLDSL